MNPRAREESEEKAKVFLTQRRKDRKEMRRGRRFEWSHRGTAAQGKSAGGGDQHSPGIRGEISFRRESGKRNSVPLLLGGLGPRIGIRFPTESPPGDSRSLIAFPLRPLRPLRLCVKKMPLSAGLPQKGHRQGWGCFQKRSTTPVTEPLGVRHPSAILSALCGESPLSSRFLVSCAFLN